jgi:hypothetical protein
MESRTNKKRPWEDENAIDVQPKRAGPNVTAFINQHPSPLPPRAGHYTHGDYVSDQKRLPLRPTSSESMLAELVISNCAEPPPSLQAVAPLDTLKPRAQSLFDVFQHRPWKTLPSSHAGTVTFLAFYLYSALSGSAVPDIHPAHDAHVLLERENANTHFPRPSS